MRSESEACDRAVFAVLEAARRADPERLSRPDPETGERWGAAEIMGHVAEMLEFWLLEFLRVATAEGAEEPVFGRRKDSPERARRIAAAAGGDLDELYHLIALRGETMARALLLLDERMLARHGRHVVRGSMPLEAAVQEWVISHLYEHADQLIELVRS
jgi:hypothetical protein